MTESQDFGGLEPRYFGRRVLAFLLDAVLATFVIVLLFKGVFAATGIELGTPQLTNVTATDCSYAPPNYPQVTRVEAMWPLAAGEKRENILCKTTVNGKELSLQFVTRVISEGAAATYTRSANYPVDDKGQPLPIEYAIDWSLVAYVLLFATAIAHGRRTPGKSIMGLRVARRDSSNLSWATGLKREALKALPLLLYYPAAIAIAFIPIPWLTDSEAVLVAVRDGTWLTSPFMALGLLLSLGSLVWYLWPLIFWRGATWYDALSGTKVVRTDRGKPTAAPRA